MTNSNEPLFSIKEKGNKFLFNIYEHHEKLIGIEEDPSYVQLFEMKEYGTPSDYFDWRSTQIGFSCLLDIEGNALLKNHQKYRIYRRYIHVVERSLEMKSRKWENRVRE